MKPTTRTTGRKAAETFDQHVVRFIRTFADDVRHVTGEMAIDPGGKEVWYVCAPIDGVVERYRVPDGLTIGEALRMFPEFSNL